MSPKTCSVRPSFGVSFKVSIIGCGSVGATAAYAILIDGTPTEIVLYNRDKTKAEGLLLDFEHSLSFLDYTKLTATDDFNDCAGSDLIVVTAGARQEEGESRLDLIEKNRKIFQDMIPKIAKAAPDSILLIVTNPVDVLTHDSLKLSGFPEHRVFGTGTILDTARFQFHISKHLCISPKSIQAYILGEHGTSSFPVLSSADVAGKPILDFEGINKAIIEKCYIETINAADRIIHDLGYTCYSIATVIREIMEHIFQNSRLVTPLSVKLNDYYGHSDVTLSVPCILDSTGIADIITIPLDEKEQEKLAYSVKTLKEFQS